MRGRRPWLVNGRIDGSGRACQRPRTSSGAKCFSCEGALAREIAFFKFLAINVALGGAGLAAEERGVAKPRGHGLGQRNINGWRVLIEKFFKPAFLFFVYTATFFQNPCCAARGHALAIWHRYAAPRSIRPRSARAPLGGQMRSAPAQHKLVAGFNRE